MRHKMKWILFIFSLFVAFFGLTCYCLSCFALPLVNNDALKDFGVFAITLSCVSLMIHNFFKLDKSE